MHMQAHGMRVMHAWPQGATQASTATIKHAKHLLGTHRSRCQATGPNQVRLAMRPSEPAAQAGSHQRRDAEPHLGWAWQSLTRSRAVASVRLKRTML